MPLKSHTLHKPITGTKMAPLIALATVSNLGWLFLSKPSHTSLARIEADIHKAEALFGEAVIANPALLAQETLFTVKDAAKLFKKDGFQSGQFVKPDTIAPLPLLSANKDWLIQKLEAYNHAIDANDAGAGQRINREINDFWMRNSILKSVPLMSALQSGGKIPEATIREVISLGNQPNSVTLEVVLESSVQIINLNRGARALVFGCHNKSAKDQYYLYDTQTGQIQYSENKGEVLTALRSLLSTQRGATIFTSALKFENRATIQQASQSPASFFQPPLPLTTVNVSGSKRPDPNASTPVPKTISAPASANHFGKMVATRSRPPRPQLTSHAIEMDNMILTQILSEDFKLWQNSADPIIAALSQWVVKEGQTNPEVRTIWDNRHPDAQLLKLTTLQEFIDGNRDKDSFKAALKTAATDEDCFFMHFARLDKEKAALRAELSGAKAERAYKTLTEELSRQVIEACQAKIQTVGI